MRLTYEQFCHIVKNEILYLEGAYPLQQVEWGDLDTRGLPREVSLVFSVPDMCGEIEEPRASLTSDEPQDPEDLAVVGDLEDAQEDELEDALEDELEDELAYGFSAQTFEGEIVDLNTILIHSDEGEIVSLEVYHEVPVDLLRVYCLG